MLKSALRENLRRLAKGRRRERALRALAATGTVGQHIVGFIAPIPAQFEPQESRHIRRFDVDWKLYPAHYFQWHQYFGFADPVGEVLLRLAAASRVILDVGANVGFYSVGMARQTSGSVFAFEPVPSTFLRLAEHARGVPNLTPLKLAVSARVGHADIFDGGTVDSGKASLREGGQGRAQTVQTTTLDEIRSTRNLGQIDLIKIDVEGLECDVLRGGLLTIEQCRPAICLELSPRWMSPNDFELFLKLKDMGYAFEEIRTGPVPLERIGLRDAWARETQTNLLCTSAPRRR